jgi:hypothetical protein
VDSAITFNSDEVSIYYGARVTHLKQGERRRGAVPAQFTAEKTITVSLRSSERR